MEGTRHPMDRSVEVMRWKFVRQMSTMGWVLFFVRLCDGLTLAPLLQFCIICRDGAAPFADNTLYMCDFCPRVMCRLCMELPPGLDDTCLQENVKFQCICCHIGTQQHGRARSPYYVSFLYFFCRSKLKLLYSGFLPWWRTCIHLSPYQYHVRNLNEFSTVCCPHHHDSPCPRRFWSVKW